MEFAGDARLPDQELNGIMFAGVGNGTTVDFVQSSFANDDAIEWFGGTVNGKHIICFAPTDDIFDMDEGYSGKNQFGLGIRHPNFFDLSGSGADNSNGLEWDSNTTSGGVPTSSTTQYSPVPPSTMTCTNFTLIGPLRNGEAPTSVNNAFGWMVNMRTNPASGFFNSIVIGGQDLGRSNVGAITGLSTGPSNYQKWSCDSLVLGNNYLANDNANANALFITGGFAGTTAQCSTPVTNAATLTSLLTSATYNNTITTANLDSAQAATSFGITRPYYRGTKSGTGFGFSNAGTVS